MVKEVDGTMFPFGLVMPLTYLVPSDKTALFEMLAQLWGTQLHGGKTSHLFRHSTVGLWEMRLDLKVMAGLGCHRWPK